jgi:hypothetical protein
MFSDTWTGVDVINLAIHLAYLEFRILWSDVFIQTLPPALHNHQLQHYNTITLQHYKTTTLQHYNTTTLQNYNTITLQNYNTITLQYYNTTIL